MTTAQADHIAVKSLSHHSTEKLVELFELTDQQGEQAKTTDDRLAVAKVRGWIMDALEARDPQAFAAWIDGDIDGSPARYFNA